jgi:putative acetyltransferase
VFVGQVAAIGAFKVLEDPTAIELKSMHTAQEFRGQGLGGIVLQGLLQEAVRAGAQSAWLDTGSDAGFAPARALYERAGFSYCPPFGSYTEDPLSVFMTLEFGIQFSAV